MKQLITWALLLAAIGTFGLAVRAQADNANDARCMVPMLKHAT